MDKMLGFVFDFLFLFLLFYIIFDVFVNKKKKNFSKLKKNDEVRIFVIRYNIDVRKINYKKLLKILSFINAFIFAFASTLVFNIESILWSIIVGFIVVFILIYALFEIAGRYVKKMEEKNV